MKHPTAQERRAVLRTYAKCINFLENESRWYAASRIKTLRNRYRASVKKTTKGRR